MDHNIIPIVSILSVFVFFPLAIAHVRTMWRRGSLPASPGVARVTAERLERMEQAMDAIAIELTRDRLHAFAKGRSVAHYRR